MQIIKAVKVDPKMLPRSWPDGMYEFPVNLTRIVILKRINRTVTVILQRKKVDLVSCNTNNN